MTADPVDAPGETPTTPTPPGYSGRTGDHLNRLTKVEGQVRGVARMVEEDRYCIDVLTQITAATKALQQVALGLLDDHMRHCVTGAVQSSADDGDQKLTEVNRAVALALRL